jgi:hypothetical protein
MGVSTTLYLCEDVIWKRQKSMPNLNTIAEGPLDKFLIGLKVYLMITH